MFLMITELLISITIRNFFSINDDYTYAASTITDTELVLYICTCNYNYYRLIECVNLDLSKPR